METSDLRDWICVIDVIPEGPARLQRPDTPTRPTFETLVRTWGKVRDRSIVPIEAVRPGDQQVVAASGTELNNRPIVSLDTLADFPEVVSVVASTIVEARRPLPSLRELLLLHCTIVPDRATLRCLNQLEALYALHAPNDRVLALKALPADTLRRLAVSRDSFPSLDPLGRFTELSALHVNNCYPGDSLRPVAHLSKLRQISIDTSSRVTGWKALGACTELETAELYGLKVPDLRAFSKWTRLRRLAVPRRGLQSLVGVEALTALEELSLGLVTIDDLAPVRGHQKLRSIYLGAMKNIHDIDALGDLPALEKIEMEGGDEDRNRMQITSLRPLARCLELQDVQLIDVVVADGDLSALVDLPKLRRVKICDDGTLSKAIAALRRARPEVSIEYNSIVPIAGEKVGETTIHPPTDGIEGWWIRDTLAAVLGVSTNYAAEKKIRQALTAEDVALKKRLSFDTESGAVSIEASSEEDIRAVALLINRLAGNSHGK